MWPKILKKLCKCPDPGSNGEAKGLKGYKVSGIRGNRRTTSPFNLIKSIQRRKTCFSGHICIILNKFYNGFLLLKVYTFS